MKLDFKNNLALLQWLNLRQKAVALLTCIFVYFYIRNSRKRKISYSMSSEREIVQEEITSQISSSDINEALDASIHQEHSSGVSTGTSRKKQKVTSSKEKDSDIMCIKNIITEFTAALQDGNEAIRETIRAPRMEGAKVWKMITDYDFSLIDTTKLYRVLMRDVDQLKAVIECPSEAREHLLNEMLKDIGSI